MNKSSTRFIFAFLLAGFFLYSCNNEDTNTGESDMYYPVEKVVKEQIDSLKKNGDTWKKTVINNFEDEEKSILSKDVDWKTELALFSELNPNKKAYLGKFNVDTAFNEYENVITYTSPNIKLSMLTIILNKDGSLRAIYGDLNSSNLFYQSTYQLSFVPNKAYGIAGKQTLAFFNSEENFQIQWIKQFPDSLSLQ